MPMTEDGGFWCRSGAARIEQECDVVGIDLRVGGERWSGVARRDELDRVDDVCDAEPSQSNSISPAGDVD
jgi:hypothetical protein